MIGVTVGIVLVFTFFSLFVAVVIILLSAKLRRTEKMGGIDFVHSMSIFRRNSLSGLDKMAELMEDNERYSETFPRSTLEFPRKNLEWGKVLGECAITALDFWCLLVISLRL